MQLEIFDSEAEMVSAAVFEIRSRVKDGGSMGFATGRTPLAIYAELAESGWCPELLSAFALDEYVGECGDSPNSFAHYVRTKIEKPLGLPRGFVRVPNGCAENLEQECMEFESAVTAADLDLQILGVGTNGHIAFNEPGSSWDSITRVVDLTEQTRADNSEDFDGVCPPRAITQGISTIMRAKHLLLIARGPSKRQALKHLIEGQVNDQIPVTHLLSHGSLKVLADKQAAALIS